MKKQKMLLCSFLFGFMIVVFPSTTTAQSSKLASAEVKEQRITVDLTEVATTALVLGFSLAALKKFQK
ncbi:MAG: hypothetical protein HC879_05495 [Leptolyngbyaceae cyanobacterium SL_5_9]|nr:hypothetical protein [Leptolyngbyaceae cyanobacterium SL_5_9]